MAMTVCRECKAKISTTAETCPQCGAKVKKTSGCALVVAGLFVLIALASLGRGCADGTPTRSAATPGPARAAAVEPAKAADPAVALSLAKKTVDEIEARLKSNEERLKKYYGTTEQVQQATTDLVKLAAIKGLYEKSDRKDEKGLGARADTLITRVSQQQRAVFASATEEIFIKSGMDIKVTAAGAKKDQLRLKYVLMSQPLVYKFQNEAKLPEQARFLGFRKIVYSDGYDETWNVDL
jgi:hypothetical protein